MGSWGSKPKVMGQTGPSPQGFRGQSIPTLRHKILHDTQGPRDFMDTMFQNMIQHLTPEDFLKLGNPAQCSKYIFLMADSLNVLFNELQIYPRQDKESGVVIFQKIDDITKNPLSGNKQLCLMISYYYIRVFQIFGALAMTVVDDSTIGESIQQPYLRRPQEIPFRGGVLLTETEFNRRFPTLIGLFKYINRIGGADRQFGEPTIKFHFKGADDLTLVAQDRRIDDTKSNLIYNSEDITIRCKIYTTNGLQLSNFTIGPTQGLDKRTIQKLNSILGRARPITVSIDRRRRSSDNTVVGSAIKDKLDVLIEKLFEEFELSEESGVEEWQTQTQERGRGRGYDQIPRSSTREDLKQSDVGTPKMLQNGYIIATLKKLSGYKSTSFCIARALQLIDANYQLNPTRPPVSSVCMSTLPDAPTSVPISGKPLSIVPAFRATEQLFFTKFNVSQDKKIQTEFESQQSKDTYGEFLKYFADQFGDRNRASITSLDTIIAKMPNCPPGVSQKQIRLTHPEDVKRVVECVKELFNHQTKHSANVERFIMQRLLSRKTVRDSPRTARDSIVLNPALLGNNLQELAKVSAEARMLLANYFLESEAIYKKGMEIVLKSGFDAI